MNIEREQYLDSLPYYTHLKHEKIGVRTSLVPGYQFYIKKKLVVGFLYGFGVSQAIETKIRQAVNDKPNNVDDIKFNWRYAINLVYKF